MMQVELFKSVVSTSSRQFIDRVAAVIERVSGNRGAATYDMAARAIDGTCCPTCGARQQVYKRSLSREQVKQLRSMVARFEGGQVFKSSDIPARGGDYAKLASLGMLEHAGAGLWRVTEYGRRFAAGEATAPRFSFWFRKELVAVSASEVRVAGGGDAAPFTLNSIGCNGGESVVLVNV